MAGSETLKQLQKKILKILGFLFLIRLGLYIPVPNVDLDIFFTKSSNKSIIWFGKKFNRKCFSWYWFIGILPYINSSIVIQLLTPVIPSLERLQKEEGELGRQQITRYTRYLTLAWAIVLSTGIAFFCKTCCI